VELVVGLADVDGPSLDQRRRVGLARGLASLGEWPSSFLGLVVCCVDSYLLSSPA